MTNSPYVRSALAQVALELASPLIRETLLNEPDFREEYGFWEDAVLTFDDSGVSVQRHELFDAIRKIFSGESETEVTDTDGRKWRLNGDSKIEGQSPILPGFSLSNFAALSPDRDTRLRALDQAASAVNLPASARDGWHNVLSERALDDEEVNGFHSDVRETPVHRVQSIRGEIIKGESGISSYAPCSRRYFERLIGAYDGSASIRDYAVGKGRRLFEQLSAWRPYDGFLFSLFLSSHSALTAEISVEHLGTEDLVRTFDFLTRHGDRISQLGAIEVGLRVLRERPEIEPALIRLIQQIRDDDIDGAASGFKLLSALFHLVDGELSRTRLLSPEPPFYRRLASLSQAALIHRQLVNSGVGIDPFCEWAFSSRRDHWYSQSLTDMRLEPRWDPGLAAASQLKAYFLGRIMIAAKDFERNIKGGELHDLVLGTKPGSLHSLTLSESPRPFLPGPLEGAEDGLDSLPAKLSEAISEAIKVQLGAEEVTSSSFIALVNSARIFRVDSDQAGLAAEALKLGGHRLANVEDRSQLLATLQGLATVAAVTRSSVLADELRILAGRYRRDPQYPLSIREDVWICLVAAASRADLNDWRDYVGDWLTELAFGNLAGDDGKVLHLCLQYLCHAVPELWVSCGRADAAVMAFNDR